MYATDTFPGWVKDDAVCPQCERSDDCECDHGVLR